MPQHQQQSQPLNLTLRSNSEATFSMHDSTLPRRIQRAQPSSYGIEPIMPEVITDQSAVHAVTKSFNRQMLPDVLRTALSQYYDTAAAKLKEEEHSQSFRWGDELKFLLREWNFIFMAPVSDTTSAPPPSESQPLSRLGSGTFSRQSSFSRRRRMSPGKRTITAIRNATRRIDTSTCLLQQRRYRFFSASFCSSSTSEKCVRFIYG